jgi:DNA-binding XRE family transcriptional regulator
MKSATLRERLGLTRAEWARALNVNERTVVRWEEDETDPGGLASEVMRGIQIAIDQGVDAKEAGRLISLGIGSLLFYGLTHQPNGKRR